MVNRRTGSRKFWKDVREIPTSSRTVHPRELHSRGASINPASRLEVLRFEEDPHDEGDEDSRPRKTIFYRDGSQSIIARNNSPDVGFETSVNPYRGCEHGCVYCYARPTHEYLGFSAGTDFESRIMVKIDAPQLLEDELCSRKWCPQVIAISGVTDPYQPVEQRLKITRGCLEVLARFRNPVGVMVAPIIPGLTDHEMPMILQACAKAGAQFAGYTIVRLPFAVAPLFERWLEEHFPEKKQKVLSRIRTIRGGTKLNDPRWATRIKGEGIFAEQIGSLFQMSCRKYGIGPRPELSAENFCAPRRQLSLFD